MKNYKGIIIIVLLVLLGGGGIFAFLSSGKTISKQHDLKEYVHNDGGYDYMIAANGDKVFDYSGMTEDEDLAFSIDLEAEEAKMKEYYATLGESDIEGMSVLEKYEAGYNVSTNDQDNDGLTDNDEVNVYGSDPFNASTSGDFYSDGYKIEKGLDLFTKYDYEGDLEFPRNKQTEVSFVPTKIDDLDAFAKSDMYEHIDIELGCTVYEEYRFQNYDCESMSIDLSDLLEQNGITIDDISIFKCDTQRFTYNNNFSECNYSVDGNIVTFTKDDLKIVEENDSESLWKWLFIVNKDEMEDESGKESFKVKLLSDESYTDEEIPSTIIKGEPDWGYAIISGSKFATLLLGGHMTIEYVPTGNDEYDHKMIERLKECSLDCGEEIVFFPRHKAYDVKVVEKKDIQKKLELLRNINSIIPIEGYCYDDFGGLDVKSTIYGYVSYDAIVGKYNDAEKAEIAKYKEEIERLNAAQFDFDEETFVFSNFHTDEVAGHCGGMATITAKLHNGAEIPATGSYTCTGVRNLFEAGKVKSWNLAANSENTTLMDRGLSDYKTADFTELRFFQKGHWIPDKYKTDDINEFLNLSETYLEIVNLEVDKYTNVMGNSKKHPGYDYSNVDKMIEYLDQGKILVTAFMNPKKAHVVNIYDYSYEGDEVWFYIYENNHPGDNSLKMVVTNNDGRMEYVYGDYSSNDNWYMFVCFDENLYFVTQCKSNTYTKTGCVKDWELYSADDANEKIREYRAANGLEWVG